MPRATPLLIVDWAGFGRCVKARMTAQGLTCRAVQQAVHIDFSQVAKVQRGERVLRADIYLTLCRLLDIDPFAYARAPVIADNSTQVQRVKPTEARHEHA
jgi:hypothetical protein